MPLIPTTTARRQLVEGILAPQLHTLRHNRTGKVLRLVAIPGTPQGDYIRQCYAEALCDLLDANNLLVVRKPHPDQAYPEGANVDIELEPGDLDPQAAPPPQASQHQEFKRMRPGDHLADVWPDRTKPEPNLADIAPALVTDEIPDDAPAAHINRTVADMKPTDDVRAAFERLGARMKAHEFIHRMMGPLLQRMGCTVAVMDNAAARPDGQATKCTIHVDLPAGEEK